MQEGDAASTQPSVSGVATRGSPVSICWTGGPFCGAHPRQMAHCGFADRRALRSRQQVAAFHVQIRQPTASEQPVDILR